MSGDGIVGHEFGGTVVAGEVDLGENDAAIGGGLETVGLDEVRELIG